jgi:hypothetical protein
MEHKTNRSQPQKRDSRFKNARSVSPIALFESRSVVPEAKNALSVHPKIESVTQHVEPETSHVEWVIQNALLPDTNDRLQFENAKPTHSAGRPVP